MHRYTCDCGAFTDIPAPSSVSRTEFPDKAHPRPREKWASILRKEKRRVEHWYQKRCHGCGEMLFPHSSPEERLPAVARNLRDRCQNGRILAILHIRQASGLSLKQALEYLNTL